ncbi:MAG: response regulator [Planctomycetia bacterium]|nr:response regulator [Planctomycetia bacterium]
MKQSLRIAVADDEPDMRDFFERMLPHLGHQVVSVAETGRELVEHCHNLKPDLVITDIKMPDMDGLSAAAAIYRETPLPVIVVSAYHDQECIEREELDHVLAYLLKPVKLADLEPSIALVMRRFQQFQVLAKEAADLRQALADRKLIEQAKGVLMRLASLDEQEAFRRLQSLAADKNRKLIDAAQMILGVEKALRPASRPPA